MADNNNNHKRKGKFVLNTNKRPKVDGMHIYIYGLYDVVDIQYCYIYHILI